MGHPGQGLRAVGPSGAFRRRPVPHNEPLGHGRHRSSRRRAPDGVPGPRRPSLQPPGADHLARRTPLPVVVAGRPRRGGAVADRRVRNLGRPRRDVVGARADRRRPARRLRRPGGLLVWHQGPRWPACSVRRRVGVRRAGARRERTPSGRQSRAPPGHAYQGRGLDGRRGVVVGAGRRHATHRELPPAGSHGVGAAHPAGPRHVPLYGRPGRPERVDLQRLSGLPADFVDDTMGWDYGREAR